PEHVAAFTHLGVQPRSERVFDAQVVAGRAAYRYSRSVQIDDGIAARGSRSDNQTWHRANVREWEVGNGEWGVGSGECGTRKLFLIPYSPLPTPHSPLPIPHSPLPSPQTVQNSVHNRFRRARLILIDVFKVVFHRRKFPVIAAFVRFLGRLPSLFRARSCRADIWACVDAPVIIIGLGWEA